MLVRNVLVRNVVGSPVVGEDFFDREEDRARLWERLDTDSVLLLAPRRVGKTSLLYCMEDEAPARGFRGVYATVARHGDELAFVRALYDALDQHQDGRGVVERALDTVGRLLRRVEGLTLRDLTVQLSRGDWRTAGDALLRALRERQPGPHGAERWLLMVDELPVFVSTLLRAPSDGGPAASVAGQPTAAGVARARAFLDWLRDARQDRRAQAQVRWLVAGSVGLDTIARRHGLGSTINDLRVERLGALPRPLAVELLKRLAATYHLTLTTGVVERVLDRTGWLIPYHLQLVFSALRDRAGWRARGGARDSDLSASAGRAEGPSVSGPLTVEDVDRAYDTLLAPQHRAYFDPWRQRLDTELGPVDAERALALLEVIARDPRGATRDTVQQRARAAGADQATAAYLLDALEADGYVARAGDRWRFRSPLLGDYWRASVLP